MKELYDNFYKYFGRWYAENGGQPIFSRIPESWAKDWCKMIQDRVENEKTVTAFRYGFLFYLLGALTVIFALILKGS